MNISGSHGKQEEHYHKKLQLIYPVGRHIALKQIYNNQMKFVKTPKDVKNITALCTNYNKTVLAVACRNNEVEGFQKMNVCIYLYIFGQSTLNYQQSKQTAVKIHAAKLINEIRREKVLTLRPTQGSNYIAPVQVSSKDLVKNADGQYIDTVVIANENQNIFYYDRYISRVVISKNEHFIAFILKNGPQQWYICVYDFQDRKPRKVLVTEFDYEITSIQFMPRDSTKILVTGVNRFSLMAIGKGGYYDFSEFEGMPKQNPTFHNLCYRENDHLVGISDHGEVFVIEGMQVIQTIDVNQLGVLTNGGNQTSSRKMKYELKIIVNCSFGFIVAEDTTIFFFRQIEGQNKYICILKWRIEEFDNTCITSLSVQENLDLNNNQDSFLAISTQNNQLFFLNLYKQVYFPDSQQIQKEFIQDSDEKDEKNGNIIDNNQYQLKIVGVQEDEDYIKQQIKGDKETKENEALIERINYVAIGGGFHSGEITAMDICIVRPIIVTMSGGVKEDKGDKGKSIKFGDRTVRIWNYHTGKCELTKSFLAESERDIELLDIALHPSGYYLAIAFTDKVKIYFIMDGEFKIYRELDLKKCKVLRYSTMGQYLSCVDQKEISIYYSYSLEKPQKMQSPSQNVTNLCFNHNDTIISVVSSDGFVQKYELTHFKKTGDSTIDKACNFNKCMFSRVQEADGQYLEKLYIVGHEQQHQCQLIRCYGKKDKDELEEDFKPENFYNGTKAFTSIVEVVPSKSENLSFVDQQKKARNIVLSTNDGKLMIYGTKPNLRPDRECSMMYTHCGQINVMMVSEDNKTMFTGGKDGTIFVYKVTESQNNKIGEYSRKFADHLYDLRKESQAHKEQQMQKTQKKKEIEEKNNSSIDSKDASLNRTFGDKKDEEAGGGGNLKKREDEGSESEGSDLDPEEIQRFRRVNRDMYHDIDTKLSGIVLIEKQLMDDWRKQQEQLKLDLEKEENAFESKIRRERYHQDTEVAKMEKKKSEQLNNINKEYNDLQAQETEEKDENTQAMKKMQLNHLQCMEELQQLYEKKLQMEQKQYNDLLALKKQIEANYEQELFDLQKQNEVATEKLLQEYKNNFHEVQELYDNAKRQADGLKMIQEEIQNQTEFENDLYIKELKDVFELEIKEKSDVILTIKNDIDSIKRQQKRETEEKEKYQRIKEIAESKKKTRDKLIEEKDRMIIELEEEKKQIQNQLRQKESELFKYKFKIKELDKTKAVLTHRTQEMKASLEPKEQQIENLKEKLLELEEGFQHQSKAINTLEGDVQKKEEKINEMELKLTKEKFKTKSKEQIINNFVNDVHKAYKTKNDEEYIKGLMSIYNMYVRQHTDEILENKKKDPETIEELDRQLQYMEKSIAILKKTTNSNQAKTKLNINKRRQENGQLIKGLDDVRKSKSNYQSELEKKTLTIQKLKLDKQKIQREFQKKLSQIEAETLQRVKAAGVLNQAGKEKIDSQFEQDTIYNKGSKQDEEFFSNEPGVPSKVKGKIFKGTTFTRGNKEDKNKIQDLQTQLEESNQQILMYKMEKKTLQENLIRILDERANDLGLTEEERREQLNKLNVIALNSEQDDQTFFNI